MSSTEVPVPTKSPTPPERPVLTEEPVRYLPDVPYPTFFFRYNRAFVEGKRSDVSVPNPLYQNQWLDIWVKLPVIAMTLVVFMVVVNLLSILAGMIIGTMLLLMMTVRMPYLLIERYGNYFNRKVTARFHQGGQLLKGELLQCTTGMHGTRNPHQSAFWVKVHYTFRTPSGAWIRGSVEEPRDDLQDQQLPAPGTPIIVLYFSDTEYYLL